MWSIVSSINNMGVLQVGKLKKKQKKQLTFNIKRLKVENENSALNY